MGRGVFGGGLGKLNFSVCVNSHGAAVAAGGGRGARRASGSVARGVAGGVAGPGHGLSITEGCRADGSPKARLSSFD